MMRNRNAQAGGFILAVVIVAAVAGLILIGTQSGFPSAGKARQQESGSPEQKCCMCEYSDNYLDSGIAVKKKYSFEIKHECPKDNNCKSNCPTAATVKTNLQGQLNFFTSSPTDTFRFVNLKLVDGKCTGDLPCEDQTVVKKPGKLCACHYLCSQLGVTNAPTVIDNAADCGIPDTVCKGTCPAVSSCTLDTAATNYYKGKDCTLP